MKDLATVVLSRETLALLKQQCAAHADFPDTWDEWQALSARAAREAEDAGYSFLRFELEPAEFVGWCHKVGIVPCLDALRAYAIVRRAPSRYGATPL
jgi:hypothetical protein